MTWWEWVLVVLAGWVTLAVSLGIVLGLCVRHREQPGTGEIAAVMLDAANQAIRDERWRKS